MFSHFDLHSPSMIQNEGSAFPRSTPKLSHGWDFSYFLPSNVNPGVILNVICFVIANQLKTIIPLTII